MTKRSSSGGLFLKSLLITLGVVIVTAAVLGLTVLRDGDTELQRERALRAFAESRALAVAVRGADLIEVESIVRGTSADLDIAFAAVLEGERVVASFVRDADTWHAWRKGDDAVLDQLAVGRSDVAGNRHVLVTYAGAPAGLRTMSRLLWPTVVAVVLAAMLVMPFVGTWSRRLRALVEATEKIGRGDLSESVWDPGSDELGVLALAYEEMRRKVQERDQDLRRLNEHLQERVIARTRDLERAKDVAEDASLAKSMFLANMSHEIRTPMTGILGVADLLYETQLDEPQRDYLTTISSSAQNLLRVIDDILDFSRIEAGKLELEEVDFSLPKLVDEVVELLAPHAKAKGIDISARLEAELPPRLRQDPARLRQVLINLVANSVKFTTEGGVVIWAKLERGAGVRSLLRLEVRDSGIGIPQESQQQLFEAFTQADSSTTRHFGGAGLGLAISKGLVELMGGQIGVESEPGTGSTFWLELPVGESQEPWSGDTSVVSVPPGLSAALRGIRRRGRHARILLAEDHPVNQTVALGQLEGMGYSATAVNDGIEALAALRAAEEAGKPFELVLMDCQMPRLDGYETSQRLRRIEKETGRARIPIVAVTAHAMTGDRERCLEAGMDDYLSKPFRADALVEVLERWLPADLPPSSNVEETVAAESASANVADDRSEAQVPNQERSEEMRSPIPLVDDATIQSLRQLQQATGKDLLNRVFDAYLRTAPETLAGLRRASASGDLAGATDLAHSLKGSSGSAGAARMAELSRRLEHDLLSKTLPIEQAADTIEDLAVCYAETENRFRSILDTLDSADS
ncbi:MAG: ATP-binding protein [Thermoanaerobaculia bacterium]|nr:ATP-binding protein [Thermoanaerobaculia bacterium]